MNPLVVLAIFVAIVLGAVVALPLLVRIKRGDPRWKRVRALLEAVCVGVLAWPLVRGYALPLAIVFWFFRSGRLDRS